MHDPLILVHCRHTWSCSLGSPSMWEVSCGLSELCCWDHSTQQKPKMHSTHSGSKSSKTTWSKITKVQVHQIHWWLDEIIPLQIHQNWQASRWIQDMTASRHSSGHTCTQKVPDHIMSQGQGAPGKNGGLGSNHLHRPAHRLGIIDYLNTKDKWWASLMSRSAWPQQSNPPQSSQGAYCRRSHTWICKFTLLHQAQCTSWILVNSPWWRIKPLNYLQQPLCEVPFLASSLWTGLFTRHLPEVDGPVPQRVPWMYQNHQWHHHTWSYWGGTWCPSPEPHVGSPQVWCCVQSTENTHKGPSHKLLWLPIQCQWCPPGPRGGQGCTCSPSTQNVTELQEFLGMLTHLSPFIHGLSTLTAPLQELLRKDANFTWNASYEATFQQVKQAVISDTTLRYFNPLLPVTIQVNASQVGLGAALLQDNKPIAFASKALTDAECRYANIEREASSCLWSREILHLHLWTVLHDWVRP